ncbi:MAG: asparagine synthase-related protein [Saprospiraceae bacterium]
MDNYTTVYLTVKHRGAVVSAQVLPKIQRGDYSFVHQQKLGYYFSYHTPSFGFHVVDRFASLPLFYVIRDGQPLVSEDIEELLPYLPHIKLDPIGYYNAGGLEKGERSDRTPFVGIKRIPPGHYLEYKNNAIRLHKYWSFEDLKGAAFTGNYEEACEELGHLIRQAVTRCYEFAPNAALHLSGGLDSGSITAIMCQLSPKERLAFSLMKKDAPLLHDRYESGFIGKYQQHFPHLKLKFFYPFEQNNKTHTLMQGAGNWHYANEENIEHDICKYVQAADKKVILTGLGGDELASYGHGFQNVRYSLHNDQHAKLYMKWKIGFLHRWRYRVKALLGMEEHMVDALRAIDLTKLIGNHSFWYTPEFKHAAAEWFQRPVLSLYWYPSAYNYRLEVLNRSYFTIRSDIWNFIGKKYDITYLHPLLDADLVDFCASLPRHFFRNRPARNMIKRALRHQLPSDLLEGAKRPCYFEEKLNRTNVIAFVTEIQEHLNSYYHTFAASVYNFKQMNKLLEGYQHRLKKIDNRHQETLAGILRWTQTVQEMQHKANYLNTYFS